MLENDTIQIDARGASDDDWHPTVVPALETPLVIGDTVTLIVRYAFAAYDRGTITREALLEILGDALNVRALENGYADVYGLPCPVGRDGRPSSHTPPCDDVAHAMAGDDYVPRCSCGGRPR